LETFLTVLGQMGIFEKVVEAENAAQLPFLATTTILMEAVKAGAGRESAHVAIKQAALKASAAIREGKAGEINMIDLIDADDRLPLSRQDVESILSQTKRFVGAAPKQVDSFAREVDRWVKRYPQAAKVKAGKLL